jgi:hypothetical protein
MSQDFYTLDGNKIENLIEVYDYKRYTPSKIARDLKDYFEPNEYEIVTAYMAQYNDNYVEYFSEQENGRPKHKVKLVIEK